MTESYDNLSPAPTDFDILRLNGMEVEDKIDSESGIWTVFRYRKDYTLAFNIGFGHKILDFKNVPDLVKYLNKLGENTKND